MSNFTAKISGMAGRAGFAIKKHSPEILIATGVVGVVASAVMACKATTKASDILANAKEELDKINKVRDDEQSPEVYSEDDYRKDKLIIGVQTSIKIATLYAPAIALGVLSLGAIITSNGILRKRNIALAAAYATIDKGFKEYRNRVTERFGKDVDHELRYNIQQKTITETVKDEDGNEKEVETTVSVMNPEGYSGYARFYDCGNTNWENSPEGNLMFLKAEQNRANDRLKARGYLFLNEVYYRLGIPETKAGQIVGWIYNPDRPNGDNYVDFGLYDVNKEKARDFVNGYESAILLDFNVDGNILDHMKDYETK